MRCQLKWTIVCVRYRYDPLLKKRFKTIELIIDEIPWQPQPVTVNLPEKNVNLQIEFNEIELRNKVKEAGGKWMPGKNSGNYLIIKLSI